MTEALSIGSPPFLWQALHGGPGLSALLLGPYQLSECMSWQGGKERARD